MGIQHKQPVPESFSAAFGNNYLGDPATVARLVGEFCARIESTVVSLQRGEMDADQFNTGARVLITRYGDIFSGRRDPEYKMVDGYHNFTLQHKLVADLGPFWRDRRDRWGDDAVCVLLEWLTIHLVEKMKAANGDEVLLGVTLQPSVEYVVKVLAGTEARAAA